MEIDEAVRAILEGDARAADSVCGAINQFETDPCLLDPWLKQVVCALERKLWQDTRCKFVGRVFYTLCKVRGARKVARHLSMGADVLLRVLQGRFSEWEGEYMSVVWVAELVRIPFALDSIRVGLSTEIYQLARSSLNRGGPVGEAGALLLGSFLLRADQSHFLKAYTESFKICASELVGLNAVLKGQNLDIAGNLLDYVPSEARETIWWAKCVGKVARWTESSTIMTRAARVLSGRLDAREPEVRLVVARQLSKLAQRLTSESTGALVEVLLNGFEGLPWTVVHGTLLVLGFLAMGGRLLGADAERVLPIVQQTLFYHRREVTRTYGADVRDASCFVVWGMSRWVKGLFGWTETVRVAWLVSFVDENKNVRRAARAAVQEAVGRGALEGERKLAMLSAETLTEALRVDSDLVPLALEWAWGNTERECAWEPIATLGAFDPKGSLHRLQGMSKGFMQTYLAGQLMGVEGVAHMDVAVDLGSYNAARASVHYVTGRLRAGLDADVRLAFDAKDRWELGGEFVELVKALGPPNDANLDLCRARLHNQTLVEGLVGTRIGIALEADILRVMSTSRGTQGCELKRRLVAACPTEAVVAVGLEDYTRSEEGDVGARVRRAAVMATQGLELSDRVRKSLARLAAESNMGIGILALGVLEERVTVSHCSIRGAPDTKETPTDLKRCSAREKHPNRGSTEPVDISGNTTARGRTEFESKDIVDDSAHWQGLDLAALVPASTTPMILNIHLSPPPLTPLAAHYRRGLRIWKKMSKPLSEAFLAGLEKSFRTRETRGGVVVALLQPEMAAALCTARNEGALPPALSGALRALGVCTTH